MAGVLKANEESGMVWGIGKMAELLEVKVGTWMKVDLGSPSEGSVEGNEGWGEGWEL